MSESGIRKATGVPRAPLTKTLKPETRLTFASLRCELRDEIHEEMTIVHGIIDTQSAGEFGCPKDWEKRRSIFGLALRHVRG